MIEKILDDCWRELDAGRMTLAQCLKTYPFAAGELKPLLELALSIQALPKVRPSARFRHELRRKLSHGHPARSKDRVTAFLRKMMTTPQSLCQRQVLPNQA